MKYSIKLVICIFALTCNCVYAQKAKDIEASFGQREKVYSVSTHLWMTPTYGADGRLCLMRVYPKRVSNNINYLDDKFDIDEALMFINSFAPLETRGARENGFGMSDLGGGVVWTRFNYDRIQFVFISTFRLDKPPEVQPSAVDFPIDETTVADLRRKEALQSDDDLIRKYTANPKVLEIYWTNRKCVEP